MTRSGKAETAAQLCVMMSSPSEVGFLTSAQFFGKPLID